MNNKRTVAILMAILMVMVVMPSLVPESDGVTDDDVKVYIDGEYEIIGSIPEISKEIRSGSSFSITVLVANWSDSPLLLKASAGKADDLVTSVDIGIVGKTDNTPILDPKIGDRMGDVAEITLTVKADKYADNGTRAISLDITLLDMRHGVEESEIGFSIPVIVDVDSSFSSGDAYNKFFGLFPNTLGAPLDNPWFTAAVTLVLWIIITILASYVVIPLFTKIVGSKKSKEDKDALKRSLTKTITILMFVIAFNECAQIVGANAEIMHMISAVSSVFYVLIGAFIAWQIYVFIVSAILNGIDEGLEIDGVDNSLLPLFKMIGKLLISVSAVALILAAFGVDLAGIMVSAGVVSLGITLGAQNTLNQFFSGIVLLSTRPFKKGDFVRINGEVYKVLKVKLMFTEFNNWDMDQIVTIPNNVVSSATIVNLTRDSPATRIFVYVSVAYSANLTLAKELMIKAANMHPHVIKDGSVSKPGTRLTNFQDSGIEYRLACFVDDFDNSSHFAGQLREMIYKLFLDNNVEIPYNRLEVTMLEPCDGKKKASDETID